jgi:hypothetical protein
MRRELWTILAHRQRVFPVPQHVRKMTDSSGGDTRENLGELIEGQTISPQCQRQE